IVNLNTDKAIDIESIKGKIDKNTILLFGILGSTELGIIDDLKKLNQLASEYKLKMHIDAAIGGFVIPFLDTDIPYRFSTLENLSSLNISGHKFGLSLPGCGLLLMRDSTLIDKYAGSLDYL